MKRYFFVKERRTNNIKPNDFIRIPGGFEDLDEENFDNDWRERARRLQVRRWRKLKHQLV